MVGEEKVFNAVDEFEQGLVLFLEPQDILDLRDGVEKEWPATLWLNLLKNVKYVLKILEVLFSYNVLNFPNNLTVLKMMKNFKFGKFWKVPKFWLDFFLVGKFWHFEKSWQCWNFKRFEHMYVFESFP